MYGKKVAVALSGGLDSAACAAILLEQGCQVIGVTMHLTGTATKSVIDKAHAITARLRISHHVVDLSDAFENLVLNPFCQQYASGLTPNPCVLCNRSLKFGLLLDHVKKLGADYLATGHYARIKTDNGRILLCKARDNSKDQTYFLYTLKSGDLESLLFPVGGMLKKEAAGICEDHGLPVFAEEESNDICFLGGADYRSVLDNRLSTPPGKAYDISGKEIGIHSGISNYTIGQRQGLNFGQSEKLYVLSVDAGTNSIVVGNEKNLFKEKLVADSLNWISGTFPSDYQNITAKIRYGADEVPVTLVPEENRLEVHFSTPVKAVTPGQSIVFYSGDEMLGGGIIRS